MDGVEGAERLQTQRDPALPAGGKPAVLQRDSAQVLTSEV
jgi:hypothetical protein